jgi:hypothetical protein
MADMKVALMTDAKAEQMLAMMVVKLKTVKKVVT